MKRPPAAAPSSASDRGEGSARRVWGGLLVVATLICGFMGCAEPWQRSGYFRMVPEWALLALTCLGLVGFAAVLARGDRKRWKRAAAVVALGLALLGGMRGFFGTMARADLLRRIQHESTNVYRFGLAEPPKPASAKLVEALEGLKIGAPNWLKRHAERRSNLRPPPTENLISGSRWSTRRSLAEAIIRDDALARFLMQDWKRIFPAVVGPDVDLRHRRDWIGRLDALRRNGSLGHASHTTAVFCMALIVLTDPPEFETWRVTVRDAMLGWEHPLPSEHEAMWMRTVDTLLAPDPPATWTGLTKPLTRTPDSFRHAMLAPVRGVAGHFDALKREFEDFERRNMTEHGFALWHGVGESLKHWPGLFDARLTEEMTQWRRDVWFRWLMDHSRGTRKELSETRGRVLIELTPRQQTELAASAMEWARMACEEVAAATVGANLTDSRPFSIFNLIHPYLNTTQQADTGRQMIPVMLRPELFPGRGPRGSATFSLSWVELLWKVHPLMDAGERCALQQALIPLMEKLFPGDPAFGLMLCIDAWSDMPALTPEKWLAFAWQARSGWRIVRTDRPAEVFDPVGYKPLPIPPVAEHHVESLARILGEAWNGDARKFPERLHQGLNGLNTTAPRSGAIDRFIRGRLHEWENSRLLQMHPLPDLLKMDFHLLGLYRLNDAGLQALREAAADKPDGFWRYGMLLYRTKNSANPFFPALHEPESAAREVMRWIDHPKAGWVMNDLTCWLATSPPSTEVMQAIWDALRMKSHQGSGEIKATIYGVLFRMSSMVPSEEVMAMRRDYLNAMTGLMNFCDDEGWVPPNPLHYPGGGLGIPWEDDELSARHSWSTHFGRLTHLHPFESRENHANSTFRHLALGVFPFYQIDPGKPQYDHVKMPPLSAPFEASPWQKARELHLRRPDLKIR